MSDADPSNATTTRSWEALRNRALTLAEKKTLREFYDGSYQLRSESPST